MARVHIRLTSYRAAAACSCSTSLTTRRQWTCSRVPRSERSASWTWLTRRDAIQESGGLRLDQLRGVSILITANVIYRVFRLKVGQHSGTGFAVEEDEREYLVTARHLAEPLVGNCHIELFKEGAWSPLEISTVGHGEGDIDISVLALSERLTPERPLPLQANSTGLVYGQDVYFLGFPYGISDLILGDTGCPVPLVKRATVSSLFGKPYLLDGHNNIGFSGGPVVFRPAGQGVFQVAAVVSGYRGQAEPVVDEGGQETQFRYTSNTGIIHAYDVNEAISLIRANPKGLSL